MLIPPIALYRRHLASPESTAMNERRRRRRRRHVSPIIYALFAPPN